VAKPEAPAPGAGTRGKAGRALLDRYTVADLGVLTRDEASRFSPHGEGDPRQDAALAWELLYRLEPGLYDRLASAERLHPGVIDWLPRGVDQIVEVGAGTGRLTMRLIERGRRVVAVEPALPLRRILRRKVAAAGGAERVRLMHGYFDQLALPDDFATLVVSCSAFTPSPAHGGEAGLSEMERVCGPNGCVAIIWPNHLDWLAARGYRYLSFPGPMFVEFGSHHEAVELAEIFYPRAAGEIRRRGLRRVPFEVLGLNPPRDLAYKVLTG
jgi:SAM-dependent methyltransferase